MAKISETVDTAAAAFYLDIAMTSKRVDDWRKLLPRAMQDVVDTQTATLRAEKEKYRHLLHDMETTDVTIAIQERESIRQQRDALIVQGDELRAEVERLRGLVRGNREEILHAMGINPPWDGQWAWCEIIGHLKRGLAAREEAGDALVS